MRQSKKIMKEICCQRYNVKREDYGKVCSTFHGEQNNQDSVNLFGKILSKKNLNLAYMQVVRNKKAADQVLPYLKENREILLEQPVLRVEIPKPTDGKRKLRIPMVIDRMIQQAIKSYSYYFNLSSPIITSGFVRSVVHRWQYTSQRISRTRV